MNEALEPRDWDWGNLLDLYTIDELVEHLCKRCDSLIVRGEKTDARTGVKIPIFGNKGRPFTVLLLLRPVIEGYIELLYKEKKTKTVGALFNVMGMMNYLLGLLKIEERNK